MQKKPSYSRQSIFRETGWFSKLICCRFFSLALELSSGYPPSGVRLRQRHFHHHHHHGGGGGSRGRSFGSAAGGTFEDEVAAAGDGAAVSPRPTPPLRRIPKQRWRKCQALRDGGLLECGAGGVRRPKHLRPRQYGGHRLGRSLQQQV